MMIFIVFLTVTSLIGPALCSPRYHHHDHEYDHASDRVSFDTSQKKQHQVQVKEQKSFLQKEQDRGLAFTAFSSVSHQCQRPEGETRADRNKVHFRGTALGGWLVLEPWITPSLFYQFLGASEKWGDEAPDRVGLDSYTFCSGSFDDLIL